MSSLLSPPPCSECKRDTCEGTHARRDFIHPITGHLAQVIVDDEVRPTELTLEIVHSRYPGEEHILMGEMAGVVLVGDIDYNEDGSIKEDRRVAKIWAQVADGTTLAKAMRNAADLVAGLYHECKHEDDPGVPHCYCEHVYMLPPGEEDVLKSIKALSCCRGCESTAPLEYFGLTDFPPDPEHWEGCDVNLGAECDTGCTEAEYVGPMPTPLPADIKALVTQVLAETRVKNPDDETDPEIVAELRDDKATVEADAAKRAE